MDLQQLQESVSRVLRGERVFLRDVPFAQQVCDAASAALPTSSNNAKWMEDPLGALKDHSAALWKISNLVHVPRCPSEMDGIPLVETDAERTFAPPTALNASELDGWIEQYYPKTAFQSLPVRTVAALTDSLRLYHRGVNLGPALGVFHPFHGIELPTEAELPAYHGFLHWLLDHGPSAGIRSAIDIGCGCGVVSALLLQAKVLSVLATDQNVHALLNTEESVQRHWQRKRGSSVGRDVRTAPALFYPAKALVPTQREMEGGAFDLLVYHAPLSLPFQTSADPLLPTSPYSLPSTMKDFFASISRDARSLLRHCRGSKPCYIAALFLGPAPQDPPLHKRPTNNGSGCPHNKGDLADLFFNQREDAAPVECIKGYKCTVAHRATYSASAFLSKQIGILLRTPNLPSGILRSPSVTSALAQALQQRYGALCMHFVVVCASPTSLLAGASPPHAARAIPLGDRYVIGNQLEEFDWHRSWEYSVYMPKEGPVNHHHWAEQLPTFSYLASDFMDLPSQPEAPSSVVPEAKSERSLFNAVFRDEISNKKGMRQISASKKRKVALRTQSEKDWFLDKHACEDSQERMRVLDEIGTALDKIHVPK